MTTDPARSDIQITEFEEIAKFPNVIPKFLY